MATKTVRQNESREASLDYVVDHGGVIFDAVSEQPWSGDAAVTVSIVSWSKGVDVTPKVLWLSEGQLRLETEHIPSSLRPSVDVRHAQPLPINQRPPVCFQGQTPGITGGYVIDAATRAALVAKGAGSSSVIHPFLGGKEMLEQVGIDRWVIDIPHRDLLVAQATAPAAMAYLSEHALPTRQAAAAAEAERSAAVLAANPAGKPNRHHAAFLAQWWQLGYRRMELLDAIAGLDRYLATSRVASEKRATVFAFVDAEVRPGDSLSVFALDDDYSFGVLSSATHRAWFEARCSTLETRLRYTPTTVWDSFPWPQSPSEVQIKAIVSVVADLLEAREGYLRAGVSLKRQYDALRRPGRSRLRDLHAELDAAVLAAYEFSAEDDILAQLLALNQDLAVSPASARGPGPAGLPGAKVTNYRLRASGTAGT